MKISYLLTLGIALGAYSQINFAGEIADTYTTGDTLTATKMNNLKTAVNDNDSRIISNVTQLENLETGCSEPGWSIKSVAADGSITCEFDDSLNGTFDVLSVSSTVAVPRTSVCQTSVVPAGSTGFQGRAATTGCGTDFIYAPVSLPDFATVVGFRCDYYDNAPVNADCYLENDAQFILASVFTSGADSNNLQMLTATSVASHVIDNFFRSYYVIFRVDSSAPTTLVPIRAVISYRRR